MGAKVVVFPKKTVDFACQPPYIDFIISDISGISGMPIRLLAYFVTLVCGRGERSVGPNNNERCW